MQPPNPYGSNPYAQQGPYGQPQQPQNPYAPPQYNQTPGGYMPGAGPGYEFSPPEETVIRDLAGAMRFVGIISIIFGVLMILGGLGACGNGDTQHGPSYVVQGVVMLLTGIWTKSASASFRLVVDTQGNDIPNMMNALSELKRVYNMMKWLFIIALALIVVGIALAVVFVGSMHH